MLETSAACLCNFNPHSPEGSDWNPKSEMLRFQEFQSTPPMKGATVHVAYEASHVLISIHAPVKGATRGPRRRQALRPISIHAPVKGATQARHKPCPTTSISIHAPVKGATPRVCRQCRGLHHFNPRFRERSDRRYPACMGAGRNFNPRSREGSDPLTTPATLSPSRFQSTLP